MICVMRARQHGQSCLLELLKFLAHSSQNAWWPQGTTTCVADALRQTTQVPAAATSSPASEFKPGLFEAVPEDAAKRARSSKDAHGPDFSSWSILCFQIPGVAKGRPRVCTSAAPLFAVEIEAVAMLVCVLGPLASLLTSRCLQFLDFLL